MSDQITPQAHDELSVEELDEVAGGLDGPNTNCGGNCNCTGGSVEPVVLTAT